MSESKKFNFRDPQNIIAIGVTIISLCAFVVSLMQTRIMHEERELLREYSRASAWPRLELGLSKGHNQEDGSINKFAINLTNSGVGPAIITDVRVSYADSAASNWWQLFKIQQIPDSIETYITNTAFNGRIIKIGETLELLNLDDNLPLATAFYNRLDSVSIDIYYESIYKEVWKYEAGGETTKMEEFEGLPDEEQFRN